MSEDFVKIKYTDCYEKLLVIIDRYNFTKEFIRNEWTWVPKHVAVKLLKNNYFITEQDIIFNPDIFKKAGLKIGLKRFGAYGDLLQLVPIVKYLKRTTNNKYYLLTNDCYIEDFKKYNIFDDVFKSNKARNWFDKVIFLDGVLEKDHSNSNHERYLHRIHIVEEFFNINLDYYDFSVNINSSDKKYVSEMLTNAILQQK